MPPKLDFKEAIYPTATCRHNHYVPIWYQERFMLPDQDRYFRLDLKPEVVTRGKVNIRATMFTNGAQNGSSLRTTFIPRYGAASRMSR